MREAPAATELPTGTVTFLFTDIEGSTRLVQGLGSRYPAVLEEHQRLMEEAFAAEGGIVVGTEGDSFFVVFTSAQRALTAATAAQLALRAHEWPEDATVRVRMGLHTGEAVLGGRNYTGVDVHRAARIAAAAHGGQVIVSETTAGLLRESVPAGAELVELGEHRLKDLLRPERLYQLAHPALVREFPPLATLTGRPNNLPVQTSPFLGRDAELRAVRDLLESASVRLVTLTGPGGIGKTRLALQVGAELSENFEDGVFLADLTPARDPEAAVEVVARVLGVTASSEERPLDALIRELGDRRLLLLLDNLEQVVTVADEIAELLRRCPAIKVLATSREALRIRGERLFPVPPLVVPPAGASLTAAAASSYESVRLFVERASEARPGFILSEENAGPVAELCARLDGLPLAIELAAALLTLFSPAELRDRLRDRLELLRGGARDLPARQQTLRRTIEWSYELLDGPERTMFRLFSIFSSGRVAAVEAIAAEVEWAREIDVVETMTALVRKSLVRASDDPAGERLSMLGTIREYARERLEEEPDLSAQGRRAHAAYYTEYANERREALYGPAREEALDALGAEMENLGAAWRHWVEVRDLDRLDTLLEPVWVLYEARGWYNRAVESARELLDLLSGVASTPDRVGQKVALATGLARGLLALRGYTAEVDEAYGRVLGMLEEAGGLPQLFPVLRGLANFHLYRAEFDKGAAVGRKLLDLAEERGDVTLQVEGHLLVGSNLAAMGAVATGLEHLSRAIELFDPDRHAPGALRFGASAGIVAHTTSALYLWLLGHPDQAVDRGSEGLMLAARLKHPFTRAYAGFHVALLDLWRGMPELVEERARGVFEIADEHGYEVWKALSLVLRGVSLAGVGRAEEGLELSDRGIAMYRGLAAPPVFWPLLLAVRGRGFASAGRPERGIVEVDEALAIYGELVDPLFPEIALVKGDLLLHDGGPDAAEPWFRRALDAATAVGARMYELRAAMRLARLREDVPAAALERVRLVYETFTEGFDEPDLVQARDLLGGGPPERGEVGRPS